MNINQTRQTRYTQGKKYIIETAGVPVESVKSRYHDLVHENTGDADRDRRSLLVGQRTAMVSWMTSISAPATYGFRGPALGSITTLSVANTDIVPSRLAAYDPQTVIALDDVAAREPSAT
jgi:hypothetical protein